jgi:hypothetical protein
MQDEKINKSENILGKVSVGRHTAYNNASPQGRVELEHVVGRWGKRMKWARHIASPGASTARGYSLEVRFSNVGEPERYKQYGGM